MTAAGAILEWYGRLARDLPWRRTTDPYAILVAEVMLQQTPVARVLPRYARWLERWPGTAALAAASPGEVLGEWVGLGYNRRALALHRAVRIVAAEGWPRDAAGLRRLPGVGPYTAAAVASFAFGEPVAAVDTNVRRVAERLAVTPEALLVSGREAESNQAAIELGALVCTARAARCERCPVAALCPSRGRVPAPARARRAPPRPRFADTDRGVRGGGVAALAAARGLPEGVAPERLARAVGALERDGLVERRDGAVRLPR